MNRNRFTIKQLMGYCGALLLTAGLLFFTQSCKESIDDSNFAIAKEQTITDYLGGQENFSLIKKVFDRVPLGNKNTASPISSVLSARGNYTIFAPNNQAVQQHIDSILGEGKNVEDLSDEQAKLIAYSCIIDNGTESAYESPEFPIGGAFPKSDLADRSITCEEKAVGNNNFFLINGKSKVIKTDIKLSNGFVHVVEKVLAPSNESVPALIKLAPNMRIMAVLLEATGWNNRMSDYIDERYENEEREQIWTLNQVSPFYVAQHRYLGYTGFVETDKVFQDKWGIPAPNYDASAGTITNASEIIAAITAKCEEAYGTEAQGDLKNENNAINRFVAYHFIEGKVPHNQFVQHFNEWGYKYGDIKNPQQTTYSIDIWDYFVTVGDRRGLIKVMQDAADRKIYLNRTCKYNPKDNYKQVAVIRPGIEVLAVNEHEGVLYDNNAKNGFFYPINDILILDKPTARALGYERIRFDLSTMLPELLSYGCRSEKKYTYFPKLSSPRADGTKGYFKNILNESADTRLLYLHASHYGGTGWRDYQGDEFMVAGVYDFTLRLPPVPVDGTYEIRMGITNNTLRGMCQIYFGDDPNRLVPAGLPLDMRQAAANNDNVGWVADGKDEDVNAENDKNMRNQGYMKATKFFTQCDGKGDSNVRNITHGAYASLRRIITTQSLKANKTYYLRFKSALDKSDSQFFSDYFEIVHSSVYNGVEAEDVW